MGSPAVSNLTENQIRCHRNGNKDAQDQVFIVLGLWRFALMACCLIIVPKDGLVIECLLSTSMGFS
jgi:hypothetical protein